MPRCSQDEHDVATRLGHKHCGECGKALGWYCDPSKSSPSFGLGGSVHYNGDWAKFCTTCGKPKP